MPELAADSSIPDTPINTGGDPQAVAGTVQHIRALAMPFIKGSMVTEADGSLLIKDVPMLAVGNWTDSNQRTPMDYTEKMLESSTGNWLDNTGWSRHLGGVPRDITDKVAEAINPHYGSFTDKDGNLQMGELADIRIFPHTQKQRDTQELVRHGLIKAVSVEHYGGDERLNSATRRMESSSIYYTGWAFVNKGACKVCTLPRLNETAPAPETPQDSATPEDTMADTKELEDKISALTKELEATRTAQKPAPAPVMEVPKELSALPDAIKELSAKIDAQAAQIKALEQDGTPKTDGTPGKELEEPINARISIDRKAGTIRSV
jgi:hypothetical protein